MAETRTLLVRDGKGIFKVEIPADAKVTFGPAIPFQGKGNASYAAETRQYALRIYKGSKEHPLAVFTGVVEFRDESLPVYREVIREAGKTVWKSDEEGYKVESQVKKRKAMQLEAAVGELTADEEAF